MENGNQFLGTERIGKLMRQYAIPCIISLLVGALYNIVDQIFIANASYLHKTTPPPDGFWGRLSFWPGHGAAHGSPRPLIDISQDPG